MTKSVLIISTSPRKGGNSEVLAASFAKGAQEAGHNIETISLHDKSVNFCKGCMACKNTLRCVIRDDADTIAQKMLRAEVIAFATPVYFYDMCGQMKTLLDRTNPIFSANYAFRDIYLLASAADTDNTAIDGTITGLQGWISCFEKARLQGVVRGVGATDVGDMQNIPAALKAAYDMGNKA